MGVGQQCRELIAFNVCKSYGFTNEIERAFCWKPTCKAMEMSIRAMSDLPQKAFAAASNATAHNPQIIRYIVAGLTNTIAGFIAYTVAIVLFGAPFWAANMAALCVGLIVGFMLARNFVFEGNKAPFQASIGKYVVTICGQFLLSTALIGLLIQWKVGPIIAYIIVLPVIIALSFALQRNWVFGVRAHKSVESQI